MGILWGNGNIYTMTEEGSMAEAIFTEQGTIIEAGEASELEKKYHSRITERVNLNHATMLPGLVDSHMHLVGHGERLMRLDLSEMKSREEVLRAVRDKCRVTPEGNWVVAEGWNENEWEDSTLILSDDLDVLSESHPVILKRICRHALVANSRAMKEAAVAQDVKEPAGGVIGRYPDGRLNGMFKEDPAQELVLNCIPGITKEYIEAALRMAISDCYRLGLTGCHTEDLHYYNGFLPTYEAFVTVIEKEGMSFRANLLVHHEAAADVHGHGYSYRGGTTYIEFDSMKIFADGSLGGNTALLSKPYSDQPETQGVAIFTPEELKELVKKARSLHMPVAIHAIGDLAFEYALDAIEAFPPEQGLRDRLIHAQIMRKDLIHRAKSLPLIFDIQPGFVPSDFPWVIEKVSSDLIEQSYAWKTYLDEGIHCAGGSDAPIEKLNPLLGIHAAVTRTKPDSEDREIFGEDQCLSVYEAVSLYTKGSAYAIGQEQKRGKIAPGYTADFTVLDTNIFSAEKSNLLTASAVMTVVDGRIVYKSADYDL
ncbi:hypothetical protein SAMN05443252_104414 [Bacillus sp. OV322]|uniref:amidohydrolase n=1 Tax=Bacillus sp. OV322 TaxID=1882764 RepID=UPI0008F22AE9|nr:amidohydrolase [Bacillus sp. OV322]SFC57794.1 hypothetical protein SAMN05443252_104414 [Bacillus sp. OV322]